MKARSRSSIPILNLSSVLASENRSSPHSGDCDLFSWKPVRPTLGLLTASHISEMGKLAGLLSAGVGLAAEALSQGRPPSNDGGASGNTPNTASSYGNRSVSRHPSDAPPPYSFSSADSRPRTPQLNRQGANTQCDAGFQGLAPEEKFDSYTTTRNSGECDVDWSRDEKQSGQRAYPGPTAVYENENSQSFPYQRSRPQRSASQGPLPCPVIIPQRRPENKGRGWILAYAPVLNDCGIDQATFVGFLRSFNEASKSSPYLDVVNVAALGVGFAPGIAPLIVSMTVPAAVKYAKATQTNRQTNNFLARMNAELFEPRGLFAMVMTFKPEEQAKSVPVDMSSASATVVKGLRTTRTRDVSDTTYGELQLPPSAPLVFPNFDDLHARSQDSNLKKSGHFVADYFDRRAQAQYSQKNPNSALSAPAPQFNTRFGDPNHAANSGSLISLVSGGVIQRPGKDNGDRRSRRRRKSDSSSDSSDSEKGGRKGRKDKGPGLIGAAKGAILGPGNQDQGLIKGARGKIMKSDVLYLMIANKPTDSQMAATDDFSFTNVGYATETQQTREPWNGRADEPARYEGYPNQRDGYTNQQGGYSGYAEEYFLPQEPGLFDPQDTTRSTRQTSPWDQGNRPARYSDNPRR